MDDNGVTPMEKFSGIIMYINPQYQNVWVFPVYVLYSRLQNANIYGLPKYYMCLHAIIYLGCSPFHTILASLFFNPVTGHILPQ